MNPTVSTDHLTVRFGATAALDDVTLEIPAGRITGLLGRNGAGKSTLMAVLAGYRRATSGRVLVAGAEPYEDAARMAATVLVRDSIPGAGSTTVAEHFEIASCLRPTWDQPFADELLERFRVDRTKRIGKLSHGQRAAVMVTAGLAARAPLTLFDEPHLGMDAPSRYAFYEALLADYIEHPRTILLSTHVIDEIANVVENALILHEGRVLAHAPVAALTEEGVEVTGPSELVDELTAGRRVLSTRTLGRTRSAVVFEPLDGTAVQRARSVGVELAPIPLQDLFVALTEPTREEVHA